MSKFKKPQDEMRVGFDGAAGGLGGGGLSKPATPAKTRRDNNPYDNWHRKMEREYPPPKPEPKQPPAAKTGRKPGSKQYVEEKRANAAARGKRLDEVEADSYAKGGMVRGDGCAVKGKTKGRMV